MYRELDLIYKKKKIWAQPHHIPRMYRELDLILPAHIAARLDQLAVQPAPRLRAQLMRPPREEPKGWGGDGGTGRVTR